MKNIIIIFLSIVALLCLCRAAIVYSDCNPSDAIWSDQFTSKQSRWEWGYNEGTGYQTITTKDGYSVVELGITSQSSSSSYSDCSLHEKTYYISNGVFEARIKYEGNGDFGTLGWGIWNYSNPYSADAVWFWNSTTGGSAVGFQAMVCSNGKIKYQHYLPSIDITEWHVYRVDLQSNGCTFYIDGVEVAHTPLRPTKNQRFEMWADNYRISVSGDTMLPVGYKSISQNQRIYVDWAIYYSECPEEEPPVEILPITNFHIID